MKLQPKLLAMMLALLLVAACGADGGTADTVTAPAPTTAPAAETTTVPEAITTLPEDGAEADGVEKVAFFGFAAANAFAQATWSGIQAEAEELGVEVQFFDPNFDAQAQIAQIQDATTSGEFQAFIVQANDGTAVIPAIEEALAAGITVVAEFTPIGTAYDTIEPQVDGMIFVGTSITANGEVLADLAIQACEGKDPCKVAYLEGFRALPLDNARTTAVLEQLATAPNVEILPTVEGGYTQDTGLAASQDVLTATPDVDVIIGSSQAIMGAEQAVIDAGREGEVALIGNGAPRQAVAAVKEGRWFAVFADAEASAGAKALEIAVAAARGEDVPLSFDTTTLLPTPAGTADNLPADFEGEWDA